MALTTLDPKTALVVIDLQKGIAGRPNLTAANDVVARTNDLLDVFHHHKLPVVLVNVTGGAPGRVEQKMSVGQRPADWAELVPELHKESSDKLVTKRSWGAFTNTDLDAYLKDCGVTQVVVCGIATSAGVESTARSAHEHGYSVTLAIDAMTDMNIDAQTNSITRIFPRLGETGTVQEIIELLSQTR